MSDLKPTPGPWMIEPGDDGDYSVGMEPTPAFILAQVPDVEETYVNIATMDDPHWIDLTAGMSNRFDTGDRWYGSAVANARLIAAAPDLLAALKDAVKWAESPMTERVMTGSETLDKMRAAIAKAEKMKR